MHLQGLFKPKIRSELFLFSLKSNIKLLEAKHFTFNDDKKLILNKVTALVY